MQKHKLFELLKPLSHKEMKQLRKLVISPYFLKHGKTIELFDFLFPFHPDYDNHKVSDSNISDVLYPQENYNSQRIRDVKSYLVEVVEYYLVITHLEQEPLEKSRLLISKLFKRNMMESLAYEFQAVEKALKSEKNRNENGLWLTYYMSFLTFQSKEKNEVFYGVETSSAQKVMDNWLRWIYATTLKLANELEENRNLSESNTAFSQLIETIKVFPFHKTDLLIVALEKIYNLQSHKRMEDYYELKEFTLEKRHLLHYSIQYKCVQSLFHYLVVEGFKNKPLMASEDYALWKSIGLEIELNYNGNISSASFYNGAIELMKHRKVEQAEEFINKYSVFLSPEVKKTILNFTLANLYFLKRDFDRCFDYLIKTDISLLGILKLTYKQLQLMVFYERGEYELVKSYLDSFRHYIKNRGLDEKLFNSLLSTYKVFVHVINFKEKPYDKNKLEKLKSFLAEQEHRPSLYGWFMQKIKEMER